MLDRIVKIFTSLRLTVILLALGLVLVFWGTLAQVDAGLYKVQNDFFRSYFLYWTPKSWPHGSWLPGIPIFPAGYTLGGLLLLNLLAAHLRYYQPGKKKWGIVMIHFGVVLLLVGQRLTDLLATESSMHIRTGASKNYSESSRDYELAIVDTTDADSDKVVSIPESLLRKGGEIRHAEMPFTIRVKKFYGNSSLTELSSMFSAGDLVNLPFLALKLRQPSREFDTWIAAQLSSTTQAALADHQAQGSDPSLLGQALLQDFNSLLQGASIYEQQRFAGITLRSETQTLMSQNPQGEDLARLNRMLLEDAYALELARKPEPEAAGFQRVDATTGLNRKVWWREVPHETTTEQRDMPSGIIELATQQGRIGDYLVSAFLAHKVEGGTYEWSPQELSQNGRTYEIGLRPRRYYKPFSLHLLEFRFDRYAGTDTPKNFSSRVRLQRPDTGEDREVLIQMNSPLRYAGETYYQADWDKADEKGTILQVVHNPSWLTPYFSCVLVAAGLIYQFLSHLIGFATKRKTA